MLAYVQNIECKTISNVRHVDMLKFYSNYLLSKRLYPNCFVCNLKNSYLYS